MLFRSEQYMIDIDIIETLFVDLSREDKLLEIAKELEWNVNGHDMYPNSLAPPGDYSDVILRPVYIIRNEYLNSKFNSDCYYLCMCQTFDHYMKPLSNNNYYHNLEIMKNDMDNLPCFSFEQSYYLVKEKDNEFNLDWLPKDYKDDAKMRKYDLNWLPQNFKNQAKSILNSGIPMSRSCGVGTEHIQGRECTHLIYNLGLNSGLYLSSIKAGRSQGNWKINVGPVYGIEACHQLWLLRYLITIISEEFKFKVLFNVKTIPDISTNNYLHTNFSNKIMREKFDDEEAQNKVYSYILKYVNKLGKKHKKTIENYGWDNELINEEYGNFKCIEGNRGGGRGVVRIPWHVCKNKYGYFEDRRPLSYCDPYVVYNELLS